MGGRDNQAAVGADRDGGWLGAFFQGRYAMSSRDHKLCEELEIADENEKMLRNYVGYVPETWVPTARYEKAMVSCQEMKQKMWS